MQSLTPNEQAILKSKFQAGADGHSQQVKLTARIVATPKLTAYDLNRVWAGLGGLPVVQVRATLPLADGGDGKPHIWMFQYLSQDRLTDAYRVDAEMNGTDMGAGANIQHGMCQHKGAIWSTYRDSVADRWRLRKSVDNGVTWAAPTTPLSRGCVNSIVDLLETHDQDKLYLFVEGLTDGNLHWIESSDAGATWSAEQNTGLHVYGGFGYQPNHQFRITRTKDYWVVMMTGEGASDGNRIDVYRSASLTGPWSARQLVFSTGSLTFGKEGFYGFDILVMPDLTTMWAMYSDLGEAAGGNHLWVSKSTDQGATWASPWIQNTGDLDIRYPDSFNTQTFNQGAGEVDAWGSKSDGSRVQVCILFANGVVPAANQADVFGGTASVWNEQTVDVSDRVVVISSDKSKDTDSDTFNIEVHNEDNALNQFDSLASLYAYAQPNVKAEVWQWHGVAGNKVKTFTGIVDGVAQGEDPRRVTLSGRDWCKKLLVQSVLLYAPQKVTETGNVRDSSNYVYINKTVNDVLNDLLLKAHIRGSAISLEPSTFVFKELLISDGETFMDACKRVAGLAGLELWADELGVIRTAAIGSRQGSSAYTFRSKEDIVTFNGDQNDDNTKTAVRIIGKANLGATYLSEEKSWKGMGAPAAIEFDPTTGWYWYGDYNGTLYLLDLSGDTPVVKASHASMASWFDGLALDTDNNVWISDGFDASLGNSASRTFKKVDRTTFAVLAGPFTNPDGDHCGIHELDATHLLFTTYSSGQIVTTDKTGAETARTASPKPLPTAITKDGGTGYYLTAWDQTDMFQLDSAFNIINSVAQPEKNSNELGYVPVSTTTTEGVVAVFRDSNKIVKYTVVSEGSGVPTAVLAEAFNQTLEDELFGERRWAFITDLAITDKAQAQATANAWLKLLSRYQQRISVGAVGNPGLQKGDRITIVHPGDNISSDWTVLSIRSDQVAEQGTYLMMMVLTPYIGG